MYVAGESFYLKWHILAAELFLLPADLPQINLPNYNNRILLFSKLKPLHPSLPPSYAHILRKVSQEPVQRQSPEGETPRQETRFSCPDRRYVLLSSAPKVSQAMQL